MGKKKELVWEATKSVAANGRLVLPRLTARYLRAGKKLLDAEPSPKDLHGFHLKTERFRDILELFQPCYGASLEPQLEALRSIQEYLGAINDSGTTQRLVLGNTRPRTGRLAPLAKFLDARVAENTAHLLGDLRANLHGDGRKAWRVGYRTAPRATAAKKQRTRSRKAPADSHQDLTGA
jgi:hypothetical protein